MCIRDRCVFGKRRTQSVVDLPISPVTDKPGGEQVQNLAEPVRIIHKEQDSISAFCLNNVSKHLCT